MSAIPLKGTVGASGDLAPLAHLCLGLIGEGESWDPADHQIKPTAELVAKYGLTPVHLRAKEGLAFINGTQFISTLGAEALLEVISGLCAGTAKAEAQDEAQASYAAKVFKEDGYVDWSCPLAAVHAQIRGVTPFPGARTLLHAEGLPEPLLLQIWPGQPEAFAAGEQPPCGSLRRDKAGLSISCADGWYRLQMATLLNLTVEEMDALALCNGLLQKMPLGSSGTASRPEA